MLQVIDDKCGFEEFSNETEAILLTLEYTQQTMNDIIEAQNNQICDLKIAELDDKIREIKELRGELEQQRSAMIDKDKQIKLLTERIESLGDNEW